MATDTSENTARRALTAADLVRHPANLLALGFGAGLSPRAPGTMGTLLAIPLYALLALQPGWVYILVTLAACIVGIWLCDRAARSLGVHDHPGIVWDEICGYLITMWLVPLDMVWIVIGFVLFRFFDILKPWPIRVLDRRVGGGTGIMLDDIVAGVLAWFLIHLLRYLVLGVTPGT